MAWKEFNPKLTQGDEFILPVRYKIHGEEVDVTGYTARCEWKKRDGTVVAVFNSEDEELDDGVQAGTITIDPLVGLFVLRLTALQTALLPVEDLVYGLRVVPPAPGHMGVGTVTLLKGVVRMDSV